MRVGTLYEIVIHGVVGPTVEAALVGFDVVSTEGGNTRLRGWVIDQSALHGVIDQIAGFGLELVGVTRVEEYS